MSIGDKVLVLKNGKILAEGLIMGFPKPGKVSVMLGTKTIVAERSSFKRHTNTAWALTAD